MKLKVLKYEPSPLDYHICEDEQGKKHLVDVLVDGGLGDMQPDALVGRTIECDYVHPHIEIAMHVRVAT